MTQAQTIQSAAPGAAPPKAPKAPPAPAKRAETVSAAPSQLNVADIVGDVFQVRREANRAESDIRDSIRTYEIRDAITVSPCDPELKKKTGKKFVVTLGGNTRLKIAKELGLKTIPARVIPMPPKMNLMLEALDENNARGDMSFADSAQVLWDAFQEWRAQGGGEKVADFYKAHCKNFGQSNTYMALSLGQVFAKGKAGGQIPQMSKATADDINKNTLQFRRLLSDSGFTEAESADVLIQWGDRMHAALAKSQKDFYINNEREHFVSAKLVPAIAQKVLAANAIDPKEKIGGESALELAKEHIEDACDFDLSDYGDFSAFVKRAKNCLGEIPALIEKDRKISLNKEKNSGGGGHAQNGSTRF